MPIIKRSCIEDIKRRVNIYDVVLPYVQLKRSGSSWKGLSPFSNEKTPSFFIQPEKGIFKCFSTGVAGDIFRFLELKENLQFVESVEAIAQRFGISLEYEEGTFSQKEVSVKKELFDLYAFATEFFEKEFEKNEYIRNYWTKQRQFKIETAKTFRIGFAPANSHIFSKALANKAFSQQALKESGLFYFRKSDKTPQNFHIRFRGRLMIPIRDIQGRTIAFSARQLDITPEDDPAKEAKYINSPETPIFLKSHVLYNLDFARKHVTESDFFILVEGQLDTIRCFEQGLQTAIAPQGTAITDAQLNLMRRYTTQLKCILDGDKAGQKAAFRMLPMAFKAGLEVEFYPLPEGIDPDSLLLKEGREAFGFLKQQRLSPMAFAVQFLKGKKRLSAGQKSALLEKTFEIIAQASSAVAQQDYLQELSQLLHIELSAIQIDFQKFLKKINRKIQLAKQEQKKEPEKTFSNKTLTSVEQQLLLVTLNDQALAGQIAQTVNPEWINTASMEGQLLQRLLADISEGLWQDYSDLDSFFENDAERDFLYGILGEPLSFESNLEAADQCIRALFRAFIKSKISGIDRKIETSASDTERIHLSKARLALRKELSNIPSLK